jgi:hypothetical protein
MAIADDAIYHLAEKMADSVENETKNMSHPRYSALISAAFDAGRNAGRDQRPLSGCPIQIQSPLIRAAWLDGFMRGKAEASHPKPKHKLLRKFQKTRHLFD